MVTVSMFVLFQISNSEKSLASTKREDLPPSESDSTVKTVDKSHTSKDDGKDPIKSFSGKVADSAKVADNTEGPEGPKTIENNEVEGDGNVEKEDSNTVHRKDELEREGNLERKEDSNTVHRKDELEGEGTPERNEDSNNVRKDELREDKSTGTLEDSLKNNPESHDSAE
jgi:hypothetical protein